MECSEFRPFGGGGSSTPRISGEIPFKRSSKYSGFFARIFFNGPDGPKNLCFALNDLSSSEESDKNLRDDHVHCLKGTSWVDAMRYVLYIEGKLVSCPI